MTLRLPPEPTRRFTLASGRSIAADAYGDPRAQPVLFAHGGGQTRHAWAGSAQALSRLGFYAITMDHRGHGDSDWAGEGGYAMQDFGDDLAEVAGQLETKPVLVGASLGGLSILFAEQASESSIARAIVLVDISPRMELSGVKRIVGFMRAGVEGFASLEKAADAIAAYQPHRKREKNLEGLAKNLRRSDDGLYRWHWDPHLLEFWDPELHGREDHQEETIRRRLEAASRIEAPVLLIRGRMSDVLTEEAAAEFRGFVPHTQYVDLENTAHMVAGDRNDAFTESVAKFILAHIGAEADR